jgi:CrcB protein
VPGAADIGLVALGGAVGSTARYVAGLGAAAALGATFPYGTLAVNVTGSLAAGLVIGMADGGAITPPARLLLLTGFLGGYTTFSAFAIETVRLAEQQGLLGAGSNVAANLVLGLAAAALGVAVGRSY